MVGAGSTARGNGPDVGEITPLAVAAPGLWCRRCGKPMWFDGGVTVEDEFRKAVHTVTGDETCGDGALAAPVDWNPAVRL